MWLDKPGTFSVENDVKKLIDFLKVYRMYRRAHSRKYAARIAYDIAFHGVPF